MRAFDASHIPRPEVAIPVIEALASEALDIEIGAGQGLHAIKRCSEHPERTLVAIERTHERFKQLSQRRATHPQLTNLVPLHADAVSIFTHFVRPQSVDTVFLLYPNPYPKAKQANLRWHNMPFMSMLRGRLKLGGMLILATNIESYAREAATVMTETWKFKLIAMTEISKHASPRTHFEKKYLERGERCWNLLFCKEGSV